MAEIRTSNLFLHKYFFIHNYFECLPLNRQHVFKDSKCARQTFMCGGVSAAGRMEIYYVIIQTGKDTITKWLSCFNMGGEFYAKADTKN